MPTVLGRAAAGLASPEGRVVGLPNGSAAFPRGKCLALTAARPGWRAGRVPRRLVLA